VLYSAKVRRGLRLDPSIVPWFVMKAVVFLEECLSD